MTLSNIAKKIENVQLYFPLILNKFNFFGLTNFKEPDSFLFICNILESLNIEILFILLSLFSSVLCFMFAPKLDLILLTIALITFQLFRLWKIRKIIWFNVFHHENELFDEFKIQYLMRKCNESVYSFHQKVFCWFYLHL